MVMKYDINISMKAVEKDLNRITNRIFKLLPSREEGCDWQTPLKNLIVEIGGLASLLYDQTDLFLLLCKLEGLLAMAEEVDFLVFRATIFECLGLVNKVKQCLV